MQSPVMPKVYSGKQGFSCQNAHIAFLAGKRIFKGISAPFLTPAPRAGYTGCQAISKAYILCNTVIFKILAAPKLPEGCRSSLIEVVPIVLHKKIPLPRLQLAEGESAKAA